MFAQFNNLALFVGPADATTTTHDQSNVRQIRGVQSSNLSFEFPESQVEGVDGTFETFKNLGVKSNLSFEYNVYSGDSEGNMGLVVDGTSGAFANCLRDERNYFIVRRNATTDLNGYSGFDNTVIGIGQCAITSYGIRGAVGEVLVANVSLEGFNVCVNDTSSGANLPIVNKQTGETIISSGQDNYLYTGDGATDLAGYSGDNYSHLFTGSGNESDWVNSLISFEFTGDGSTSDWNAYDRNYVIPFTDVSAPARALAQGDINLSIDESATFGIKISGNNSACIQSFELNAALVRVENRPMGYAYPLERRIDPPIEVTLSISMMVNDMKTGYFNDLRCDNTSYNMTLNLAPRCAGNNILTYRLSGMKLISTSISDSIGGLESATMNFSSKIYDYQYTGLDKPNLIIDN